MGRAVSEQGQGGVLGYFFTFPIPTSFFQHIFLGPLPCAKHWRFEPRTLNRAEPVGDTETGEQAAPTPREKQAPPNF